MCGITLFLSKTGEDIVPEVLKSLNSIQNRGYDSVGVTLYNKEWLVYKYASSETIEAITTLIDNVHDISSNVAMGHTRWATHGAKNDINSHPHRSMNGSIIIVHNGIITNYKKLKNILKQNNVYCRSETDTEVIANLIEFELERTDSIKEAIRLTINQLEGTWALGIIYTAETDKMYVTRHGSPLLLGESDNRILCCSEISGFLGLIPNYIILANNDIVTISSCGYIAEGIYEKRPLLNIIIKDSPEPYPHWTLREIWEQPVSLMSAINNGARILDNEIVLGGLKYLDSIVERKNIKHIIGLGCGTSYHACMLMKYYFNRLENIVTVQAFDASEFSELDIPSTGTILFIICSQSGETRDLINAIEICKKTTSITIGVVNMVDSMIAQQVDCGVYLNAGSEKAVASTKSFTSMIVILSLIGMWFNKKYKNLPIISNLRNLPNKVTELLKDEVFKEDCWKLEVLIKNKNIENMFILGCGKMFAVAKEGALKIKEISYIHAEAYPGGSLKHGPFALLDNKTISIILMDKKHRNKLSSTYSEIKARDTNCYIITDNYEATDNVIRIPAIKYYDEIIYTVALQYIAYSLSISRNINPDRPRNLAKVVTVE